MIGTGEFEVMALPAVVVPSCALGGTVALALAVLAIRWGGWPGWTLGILAGIVAVGALAVALTLVFGHYVGFWWHFA